MIRKLITSAILSLLIASAVFASNDQTVYTSRDEIYTRVDELCRSAGVIGPSSFTPLPARALEIALERIDANTLSEADRKEFNELSAILGGEDEYLFVDGYFAFDLDMGANLGLTIADYGAFNLGNVGNSGFTYDRREETIVPYRYEKPMFNIGVKMDFGENVSLEARYDLGNNNLRLYESTLGGIITSKANGGIFTGLTTEWPFQAGGSFGNRYFNLILGRFPHSAGSGITGNMLIGDNFIYQEVMLASLMSNHFTYNLSITRFDQQTAVEGNPNYTDFKQNEFTGKQQFRISHRFDITLFDRLRAAVNLATIYNAGYGFDIRFLYPFVLGHNYYNYTNLTTISAVDEANNIISFEAEWAITKGLVATAQLALDQFQLPWEDAGDVPLAFGVLANLKYSGETAGGRLSLWGEAAYTNPYLYLNGKYRNDGSGIISEESFNLDYIVGYNMEYKDDFGYSGYIYGPDSIVLAAGADYSRPDQRYSVGGSILYRIKGMKGIMHNEEYIDMSNALIEQSGDDFLKNLWTPSGGWAKAEHLLSLCARGSYTLPRYSWGEVEFYAGLAAHCYFNYNHEIGEGKVLPQLAFGVLWSF